MTARDRLVIVVVVAVAAVFGSWFLLVQPKRQQASRLGDQISSAQSQLDTVRGQVTQDQTARSQFPTDYNELVRLSEAVPADDEVPSLIYEVQSAAKAAGVDFRGLELASAGAGTTSSGSTTSSSTAGGSNGSSSNASQGGSAQVPPGAAMGPAGFPSEQFTLTFGGTFFHLADFLNRLQHFVSVANGQVSVSGRLLTLNAINLAPPQGGGTNLQASVSATTYILPASQGPTANATPAGPETGSPSQPVSSSSSSSSSASAATITPPIR